MDVLKGKEEVNEPDVRLKRKERSNEMNDLKRKEQVNEPDVRIEKGRK